MFHVYKYITMKRALSRRLTDTTMRSVFQVKTTEGKNPTNYFVNLNKRLISGEKRAEAGCPPTPNFLYSLSLSYA